MERRQVRRQQQAPPQPEVRDARDDVAANMSSSSEEQENAADEELGLYQDRQRIDEGVDPGSDLLQRLSEKINYSIINS